ncbi:MAG: hypothetical protein JXA07_15420 [Spirochaetes bacterium]|nr:hypothetical protein [Spirochaetota bacterium]
MEYTVASEFNGDILVVAIHGRATEKNTHLIVNDYLKIISETKSKKVLSDIRHVEGRISFGSLYFTMGNLPKNRRRDFHNAVVDLEKNRRFDEFLETTAATAGVYLQLFYDYDEALKWLRELPEE